MMKRSWTVISTSLNFVAQGKIFSVCPFMAYRQMSIAQFSVYILYFLQSIAPPIHSSYSIPTPSYLIYTERQRE